MEDNEDFDFVASEHDHLVRAISKLDKTQHIIEPTRSEPTNLNSEFNLIKSSNKLNLNNVVEVLEDTARNVKISKKLRKTQDLSSVLDKPLEKPQAERIKRSTGYEETKKIVGRWDAVVARSRTLDFVSFPLKEAPAKHQLPTKDFLSKFKLKSELEKQLEELDPPLAVEEDDDEEEKVYPMSFEQMSEHRQYVAKLRAQQSYQAAKAKRQSKIKSKKYHRILKKEKMKQQLKEFEILQKTDPEEALKKLEALEKTRALERHTLRHKNTGKWARSKLVRAKYDKEVRQQLAEQLAVSKTLTEKAQEIESTDDEDVDILHAIPDLTLQDPTEMGKNKFPDNIKVDPEFDFGYKKYVKNRMLKFKENDGSDSNDDENLEIDKNKTSNLKFKELVDNIANLYDNEEESDNGDNTPTETVISEVHDDNKNSLAESKFHINTKKNKKNNIEHQKRPKMCKLVSTSNWSVETVHKEPADISSEFESLENSVLDKVEQKLNKLRNNIKKLEKSNKRLRERNVSNEDKTMDSVEYLQFKKKKLKPVIDEALIETGYKSLEKIQNTEKVLSVTKISKKLITPVQDNTDLEGDINSIRIKVKPKYLNTALPNRENNVDDLDDDDEQVVPSGYIDKIFEEDDLVEDFRKEKEDEINKNQLQDIEKSLPGWGHWVGKGVDKVVHKGNASKRKRNRFISKPVPIVPRRDENKGDIIIKEYKDPKLTAHKVKELPFPFSSVKEFEASVRIPLGNTFIPENAHKKLIKPSVITKAGTVIEPMNEEELLVPKNRKFKNEGVLRFVSHKSRL